MRDSSYTPGSARTSEATRREIEPFLDDIYACYDKGLSVKETLSHLQDSCGYAPGGPLPEREAASNLEIIREVLVIAVGKKGKHAELASMFNLFDPARNSRDYRRAIFDSVFRDRLEHLLTWLPAHRRRPLEELIGRPLRERSEYPPQTLSARGTST